ncbi:hypothetical protein NX02_01780 [Sphingomonas sanxanigenens DSM 19645 = NX02]|uniref:Transposase DDE domain-containing protein n=1 Tax=Sphingomonas sanxanigenens DSM 19645 = NX02 TaxID=1123269 RepID=W0A721_9SPHN|nr:hypothetical protein NX02_01780 [Sphingomonas sanxanigenens DSM 19645 = NX02]
MPIGFGLARSGYDLSRQKIDLLEKLHLINRSVLSAACKARSISLKTRMFDHSKLAFAYSFIAKVLITLTILALGRLP